MDKTLVISPVELSRGSSTVRFIEEGYGIFWVIFSIIEESLWRNFSMYTLMKEFLNMVKNLGLKELFKFRGRRLNEHCQEILEELIKLQEKFKPHLINVLSINDFHGEPWNYVGFNTQLFMVLEHRDLIKKMGNVKNYKSQITRKRPYFTKEFIYGWQELVEFNSGYAKAFEVI